MPSYDPCWCFPWSAFDTGMPVLGVGNPNPEVAKRVLNLLVKTGVYKKVMQCQDFFPLSNPARREVVIHNDFKPDNVLYDPETKELSLIDYDLVQVGPAVMDFGLQYMHVVDRDLQTLIIEKTLLKHILKKQIFPLIRVVWKI